MDINIFESIFRGTSFSDELILNMWDDLNTGQRIDFLLTTKEQGKSLSRTVAKKATTDPNPVVRMLGVKLGVISSVEDPDLYSQLSNDPSPLVRGAVKGQFFLASRNDLDKFLSLSHAERLVVIGLEDHLGAPVVLPKILASFILDGLAAQTVSEEEAADLIMEFVSNPCQIQTTQYTPLDGLDSYAESQQFEAIWNLTTCTPWIVHSSIAYKYPLWRSDQYRRATFPEEMLKRMSIDALQVIADRQYEPLLKILKEEPEAFPDKVHDSAQLGGEWEERLRVHQEDHLSDIDSLKREIREFREEVDRHFEDLSRRRGFFW